MGPMALPPAVSKVMVYWLMLHCAVMVISPAGMVAGIVLSQPVKV